VCSDVDECLIIPGSCGNGTCLNVPGRYRCVCDRGFEDPMNMQMCMGQSLASSQFAAKYSNSVTNVLKYLFTYLLTLGQRYK